MKGKLNIALLLSMVVAPIMSNEVGYTQRAKNAFNNAYVSTSEYVSTKASDLKNRASELTDKVAGTKFAQKTVELDAQGSDLVKSNSSVVSRGLTSAAVIGGLYVAYKGGKALYNWSTANMQLKTHITNSISNFSGTIEDLETLKAQAEKGERLSILRGNDVISSGLRGLIVEYNCNLGLDSLESSKKVVINYIDTIVSVFEEQAVKAEDTSRNMSERASDLYATAKDGVANVWNKRGELATKAGQSTLDFVKAHYGKLITGTVALGAGYKYRGQISNGFGKGYDWTSTKLTPAYSWTSDKLVSGFDWTSGKVKTAWNKVPSVKLPSVTLPSMETLKSYIPFVK